MSCIVKESCHKVNIKVFKILDYQQKEFSEKNFRTIDLFIRGYYILYNNKYLFLLNIHHLPKKYLSLKTILSLSFESSPVVQIDSISIWYSGKFHSSYFIETKYIRIRIPRPESCGKLIKFRYNFLLIHEYDLCVSKN